MKTAYKTRKIRDLATKPIKLEQTNKIPTIQFLREKITIHTYRKKSPAGTRTQDIMVKKQPRYIKAKCERTW